MADGGLHVGLEGIQGFAYAEGLVGGKLTHDLFGGGLAVGQPSFHRIDDARCFAHRSGGAMGQGLGVYRSQQMTQSGDGVFQLGAGGRDRHGGTLLDRMVVQGAHGADHGLQLGGQGVLVAGLTVAV